MNDRVSVHIYMSTGSVLNDLCVIGFLDTLHAMVSTRLLPFVTACAGFLATVASASSSASNVVDLGYVMYRGNLTYPDTIAYLGVPYAEPPLGERRWRQPLALDTARVSRQAGGKVVNVTEYSDFCIQGSTGGTYRLSMSFSHHLKLKHPHRRRCWWRGKRGLLEAGHLRPRWREER